MLFNQLQILSNISVSLSFHEAEELSQMNQEKLDISFQFTERNELQWSEKKCRYLRFSKKMKFLWAFLIWSIWLMAGPRAFLYRRQLQLIFRRNRKLSLWDWKEMRMETVPKVSHRKTTVDGWLSPCERHSLLSLISSGKREFCHENEHLDWIFYLR